MESIFVTFYSNKHLNVTNKCIMNALHGSTLSLTDHIAGGVVIYKINVNLLLTLKYTCINDPDISLSMVYLEYL